MKMKLILALILAASTGWAAENEAGFQSLFNGRDLTGWTGDPNLWSVQSGVIVGQTTADHPITENTFLIWTNGVTADFELHLEYELTATNSQGFANSGVQYRSKILNATNWSVGGYQADLEAGPNYSGILYDERGVAGKRGIMAGRGEKVVWNSIGKKQTVGSVANSAEIQAAIKPDDWNEYVIIAKGNHLQHFINGKLTVDVTDECESKALKSGVLALQLHVGPPMAAQFRAIRLKQL